MSAREFRQWEAFWSVEPTGPDMALWMLRVLQAALASGPLKHAHGQAWRPSDFGASDPWQTFGAALEDAQRRAAQADPTHEQILAAARAAGMEM